jgi:hypothetical protein
MSVTVNRRELCGYISRSELPAPVKNNLTEDASLITTINVKKRNRQEEIDLLNKASNSDGAYHAHHRSRPTNHKDHRKKTVDRNPVLYIEFRAANVTKRE